MQTRNRLFDDLARIAGGAAGTVAGIKEEIEALVRQRVERLVTDLDLVNREEFEAARDMAAKARTEQERLEKRVAELEAQLGAKPAKSQGPKRASPKRTAPKSRKPADKK